MRIRPYIESKDYEYVEKWIDNEKVHALWCANLIPYPVTKEKLHVLLEKSAAEWTDSAYVATETDGKVTGFFCYSVNVDDNTGFLKFIVVDCNKRGAGRGKEMLKLALRYAFDITGVESVQLNVFDENIAAKRCYERIGFVEESVAKNVFPYKNELWSRCHMVISNYCARERVNGAFLSGKTWSIPENAEKPERTNKRKEHPKTVLDVLRNEKSNKYSGGIYHKTQIDLTYNSNHIEGSRLTHDQTRYIFETNTIGVENEAINVDDVIETVNHFRCIDMVIDNAKAALTEKFIEELHLTLKSGTSDSGKDWFAVGDYKKVPNEVGGMDTALPEEVAGKMKALLSEYHSKGEKTLEDILEFHVKFEKIHPFQDGNGRVGRLIMFRECLKYNIVPFIIEDNLKMFYYRGLKEWNNEKGYLIDTCLTAQDRYKAYLDYFRIAYNQ